MAAMSTTLGDRFWSKVDKTEGCWIWAGGKTSQGYGTYVMGGKANLAHRISFAAESGPIPESIQVDHLCHNRVCVRPSHLRLATNKQNQENLLGPQVNSKSGVLGVCWHKKGRKWLAQVGHEGRNVYLGLFEHIGDAEAAVIAKRLELFTHNTADLEVAR